MAASARGVLIIRALLFGVLAPGFGTSRIVNSLLYPGHYTHHFLRGRHNLNLGLSLGASCPKNPYTAHLRTLVPKSILDMAFGTRVLKWVVEGPYGLFGENRRPEI